ncbi:MAG: tRNA preQ1(34) S-adenosylmethionine ribosyltransferase-isomerase QueA [Bdellovibrionota bacterium]|nr:MAG: tRNA preQ1(34) S-adenosylmethionine ribosyltransferase-isomerase QueA [Bdellovibrionota bacterium]
MESSNTPYWYALPEDRIAQRPVRPYDHARCMLLERQGERIEDSFFYQLPAFLRAGDILVFNASRVIPARLFMRKQGTETQVEILVVERQDSRAHCMARPMRRLRVGDTLTGPAAQPAEIVAREGDRILIEFGSASALERTLEEHGVMPIPPYIRKGRSDAQDAVDYQNPHGTILGSIAAPTAGLHFTPELKEQLRARGCLLKTITLHVGPASFLPVYREGHADSMTPGAEQLQFDPALIEELCRARERGHRVIAVGTTVVRALESMAHAWRRGESIGRTELFITPGYAFALIDGVITNFHQPGTTHLLLVEAFVGRARLEQAYAHALTHGYRFLSYGDGMCII